MASASLVQIDTQSRRELGERCTIGRDPGNDLVLGDPMVSLHHAELTRAADGTYRLRDLGSRRGTFVGRDRITEATVKDGDEILIGPTRLRFELAARAEPGDSDELRRLRAIVELSRAIGVEHDLDRLLGRVLETCFQLLRADRGTIVAFLPQSKTPCATVSRTRTGTPVEGALSTAVMSQVMATCEPYLRTEVDGDLALQRSESLSMAGVRSVLAVPLRYVADETEWLGVIQLDSRAIHNVFDHRDLELLVAIAGQAALAIKNAMLVRQAQSVRSADWQRLERVVANLPCGVVVVDDERRCVLANEWIRARAATVGAIEPGHVLEALAGIPTERLIAGDLREQVTLETAGATLIINAHPSGDGRESVVVINDITVEREQQAKAAHQDRLALIGQLAGGIAHDFNNLLFIILNYAGMLEESIESPESREDASMIMQAAQSASELVRQLLTFSRREAVKPTVIDVGALVMDREKLLKRSIGKDVELAMTVTADKPYVLIDVSQLEQILMNLAVNARDAMNGRGKLAITVGAAAGTVTIEVTDNGCGMPPEVVARVFEPYFTTKARGKGTGLGLATVHGIVQHAGGQIHVRSQVGRGTTFVITLPRTDLVPEQAAAAPELGAPRGRVLVVDDDEQVRRLTERMLRHAGYDVTAAASGPDALIAARETSFDILLTDMVMPGMSGRDLARELGREHPETRIIFMSGYHHGAPVAGWQFLAKPFDRQTLLAKLDDSVHGLALALP